MTQLIDRRLNGKNKSAVNRDRFIKRFRGQIKEAVAKSIKGRSITDIDSGDKVSIPVKDISEPVFGHARGGVWEGVHPGNQDYIKGDKIDRPTGGAGGGGGKASRDGEGEDDFAFELSREEFLHFFFDDLELPNLVKTQLTAIQSFKNVRAGYTSEGTPTNIHVVRSLKGALGRRIALAASPLERLSEAEEELDVLLETREESAPEIIKLREEIRHLKSRINAIPFIDPFDLRYSNRIKQPKPTTQAVMFCVMDVSGSMDENKKDIAKRFFILLYLFLTRNYERIEVIFVRHHTQAAEVSEDEFFHAKDTGGTVVSSALKLVNQIMQERYSPQDWNIYVAQASDGDNWDSDSAVCRDILQTDILPEVQYYAYIEITEGEPQNLWQEYEQIAKGNKNFALKRIATAADIYPVFRDLFKKTTTHAG